MLSDIYHRRHPICHHEWSTVVPADCINNDNIGKVSYLFTHADFYSLYWPQATHLTDSSYSYSIIDGNSDSAFAIDSYGELTVNNASNFTGDRQITVRVKVFDWYYHDCTCTIRRIPTADCVYFDSNQSAGDGDGTRSNPYRKWSDHASTGANLANGQPGKSYFWRRNRTYVGEWVKVRNPSTSNAYINFAGWGQGPRQKIDLSQNSTSERFVDIGTSNQTNWEIDTCHNFRMYDFEFTHDLSNTVYPIQGNPYGQNWEIHRLKATNTSFSNGFMWFIGVFSVGFVDKNFKISDIETSISTSRQVKFECGGVEGWNFKCYNDNTGGGSLVSATTHPYVTLKYIHYTHENNSNSSLGMNLRARNHVVEFAVFDVSGFPMVLFNLDASDGQGDNYNLDGSCRFKNIIVNRAGGDSLNIAINQTSNNLIDGCVFENIYSRAGKGFWVNETAKNLVFRNCVVTGSSGSGIRVWTSSGDSGTPTIENCTILGFTNAVNCDSGKSATLRNSIYNGGLSGTVNQATNSQNDSDFIGSGNYRIDEGSNLIGAGTDFSLDTDIVGVDRATSPTIGAFEYIEEPLDIPANFGVVENKFLIHKNVDFDQTALGDYTLSKKQADWGSINFANHNNEVIEDFQGSRRLKNLFPEGSNQGMNGSDFGVNLSGIGDEIYLTYEMFFPLDFEFAHPTEPYQNGKLCGFRMMNAMVACQSSTPALRGDRGAIMYPIWGSEGNFAWNVYHHEQTTNCGDRMGAGNFSNIIKGQWNKLTFRVVLNTPGVADGLLQFWVRGELVSTVTGIMFRTETSVQEINHLAIFTSTDWDIPVHKDMHLYMDNFYLWTYSYEAIAADQSIKRGKDQLWTTSDEMLDPLSNMSAPITQKKRLYMGGKMLNGKVLVILVNN